MTDNMEHARQNAKAWFESIEEMLEKWAGWEKAARAAGWDGPHKDKFGATFYQNEDGSTWACAHWKDLCEAHDIEPEESEEAREEIEQSVLSVQVRDGWRSPGSIKDDSGPEEYEILLSTGGPALRIYGRLGQHCQPESAELQMQDWGTPWTRYPAPEDTLLQFSSVFYFGG